MISCSLTIFMIHRNVQILSYPTHPIRLVETGFTLFHKDSTIWEFCSQATRVSVCIFLDGMANFGDSFSAHYGTLATGSGKGAGTATDCSQMINNRLFNRCCSRTKKNRLGNRRRKPICSTDKSKTNSKWMHTKIWEYKTD